MTTCNEDNEKQKKIDDLMSVSNLQQLPSRNDSNTEIITSDGGINQNMNNFNVNDEVIAIISTDDNTSDGGINENMNNLNTNDEKEHSNVTYHDIVKHIDAAVKGANPYILYLIL